MLLSTIFSVILFFNGAISNVVLFYKLGTLSFLVHLSSILWAFVLSWHNATTTVTCLQVQVLLLQEFRGRCAFCHSYRDKTFSSHGPTLPSSPPLFSSWSFDPSNADHIEDVPMPLNGSSPSAKDDKPIPFVSMQIVKKLWRIWGLMWKKGICFTPKFVSMPSIGKHLHLVAKKLLMPNWHMGW